MFATQEIKPVFLEKFMKKENKIKFGFPGGAIKDHTIELFKMAGYQIEFDEKFQKVKIDDPKLECVVTRPIEIAPFVEKGFLDAGIVTEAAVLESGAKVVNISNLGYEMSIWDNANVLLAVPENSNIKTLKDLKGKKIVTRIPKITKEFLKKKNISAEILVSDMLVNESKVGLVADAIVEIYNRGSTLRAYNLKPLASFMKSQAILITNKSIFEKDKWKREKIESLGLLLKGARLAQEYSGLMLHASNNMMEEVLKVLPALKKPTVTQLRGENWFDVFTVAKKKMVREIIPKLKKIGCTDIIEFPLNKVVI